jgi:hypothetical protein
MQAWAMLFNTAGRIFAMHIPGVPESWVRWSRKGASSIFTVHFSYNAHYIGVVEPFCEQIPIAQVKTSIRFASSFPCSLSISIVLHVRGVMVLKWDCAN